MGRNNQLERFQTRWLCRRVSFFLESSLEKLDFSRIDSSVAVAHVAVESWTDAEYFIIDEFKMYHECGFLKMPWAQADSIIRHIVFDLLVPGKFAVVGLASETSFQLFDLNGKVLKSGTLKNGGVVNTPTQPVILKLENGAQFLLK